MRKIYLLFGIIGIVIFSSLSSSSYRGKPTALKKSAVTTVVIDAGHGGKDPGCLGHKAKEKDIALAIALALGHDIEQNCPDVNVIFTRHDDNFVELFQRAEIANKHKADLFISIHCNSSPSSSAYGVETFVMGLNKSQANLNVAKKENSAILLENDYKKNYGGFDPNSPEAYIIFSLYQNVFLDQSLNLASKIENQFQTAGRFNRGVKQAGFLVLYKTTMPGMLVEAGFLSNPNEEEFLITESGQNKIASSIFKAFKQYKNERDGKKEQVEGSEKETINDKKTEPDSNKNKKEINPQLVNNTKLKDSVHIEKRKQIHKENKEEKSIENSKIFKNNEQTLTNSVVFKVQFATSPSKKDNLNSQFKGLDNVEFYLENGIYKYTSGNEKELAAIKKLLEMIKAKGYKDAFIVAFSDGKRLKSVSEAVNLQKSSDNIKRNNTKNSSVNSN